MQFVGSSVVSQPGALVPVQAVQTVQMPTVAPAQYVAVPQQMPMTTYAAPVAEPVPMQNFQNLQMGQFVPGQPVQLNMSQLRALAVPSVPRSPADLLARGQLASETYVTEEDLIASGNLIVDKGAEAAVAARLGQMQMQMQFLAIDSQPVGEPIGGFVEVPAHHPGGLVEVPAHHPGGVMQHHELTSEWMFGDAATGWLGIHALAHLNPLRWSGAQSFEKTIRDLEDLAQHENRAVILKIPANTGHEMDFANPTDAINHIIAVASENAQQ